jgi:hypothetical protein
VRRSGETGTETNHTACQDERLSISRPIPEEGTSVFGVAQGDGQI